MKRKSTSGELNGFLDAGSHLVGELRFEDTFRVDGRLTGAAVSDGDLVVGAEGRLEGEARVGRIFISGFVKGTIVAARRIEISASGRVEGDLSTPALVIDEGGRFDGSCSMVRPEGARPALVTGAPAEEPAAQFHKMERR